MWTPPKDNHLPSVDYIKAVIMDMHPQDLLNNPMLTFTEPINKDTGEVLITDRRGRPRTPKKEAHYQGLTFTVYESDLITIGGSLHTYWNNGGHNANDYPQEAFKWTLKDLKDKFGITPQMIQLRQIELGVNIRPPIDTKTILDNIFQHRHKPFEQKFHSSEGHYKQFIHSQYIIKVYDKAKQYRKMRLTEHPLFRFEVRWKKMQHFHEQGIFTMQDLLDHGLHQFTGHLVQKWNEILFYDPTIKHHTTLLTKLNNPNHWQRLSDHHKPMHQKHKNFLNFLIQHHSQNIKKQVADLIEEKSKEMTRGISFDPLYIMSNSVPLPPGKVCQITGLHIGMQRKDSQLLSHRGIRYYHTFDKTIYRQLEEQYLTDRWRTADLETRIREIAHNIRNHKYNPINHHRAKVNRVFRHPVLFDPNRYLVY